MLYESQYGFRKKYSTEFATLELFKKWVEINKYLDHEILLNKLNFCGIKHKASEVIRIYLSNRFQYVIYENASSDVLEV